MAKKKAFAYVLAPIVGQLSKEARVTLRPELPTSSLPGLQSTTRSFSAMKAHSAIRTSSSTTFEVTTSSA